MITVSAHEAKTQLSKLLAAVERGEEVTIARAGKPVARLVPAEAAPPARGEVKFGTAAGKITLLPGWDDPMTDEELAEWYDRPIFPTSADDEAATR